MFRGLLFLAYLLVDLRSMGRLQKLIGRKHKSNFKKRAHKQSVETMEQKVSALG